jgi:phosphoglycolate phosphatase-like HAD superfamily hydrolase
VSTNEIEPRAIVFDFDGVILESTQIKTVAFGTLFADRPEHVDAVVQLHLDHVGLSRFEKFDLIYDRILEERLSTDERARLGDRFSEIVYEQILGCAFVPGAVEFLDSLSGRVLRFVASATPEAELRSIVADRGLSSRFEGVYGAPPSKADIVRRIMREHELEPSHLVFIGDAMSDLEAARKTNVRFIGRVHADERDPFAREGVHVVPDLDALLSDWPSLVAAPPV